MNDEQSQGKNKTITNYKYHTNQKEQSEGQNCQNQVEDQKKSSSLITFQRLKDFVQQQAKNKYEISIVEQNISYLQKCYIKKDKSYEQKQRQKQKILKMNEKTIQTINAQLHKIKTLKRSYKKNQKQSYSVRDKIKGTFQQRILSQTKKNELYQHYKQLQGQYVRKMDDLQRIFSTKFISLNTTINQNTSANGDIQLNNQQILKRKQSPVQILSKIRQQNLNKLSPLIQEKQRKIQQIQSSLQSKLNKRQQIKEDIKKITQNIKSYEEQQFNIQVKIQNMENQKQILKIYQDKVKLKNQQVHQLFNQINQLNQQIDTKIEEKQDLFNFYRQVDKEQKKIRKIRKIQQQCHIQQDDYRQEKKRQQYVILQSQQDQQLSSYPSKTYQDSNQNINLPFKNKTHFNRTTLTNQSPQKQDHQTQYQRDSREQIPRIKSKSNQKILNLVQRYEDLKKRRQKLR